MSFSLNKEPQTEKAKSSLPGWLPPVLWAAALLCVAFMGIVMVQRTPVIRGTNASSDPGSGANSLVENIVSNPALPEMNALESPEQKESVDRLAAGITHMPENMRMDAVTYTIQSGDSLYGIANKFDLEPETVLWANYDVLHDDAHNISVGDELIIPPSDGIYVKWKESDQLQRLADKYRVELHDVLAEPINKFDMTNPVI